MSIVLLLGWIGGRAHVCTFGAKCRCGAKIWMVPSRLCSSGDLLSSRRTRHLVHVSRKCMTYAELVIVLHCVASSSLLPGRRCRMQWLMKDTDNPNKSRMQHAPIKAIDDALGCRIFARLGLFSYTSRWTRSQLYWVDRCGFMGQLHTMATRSAH